MHALIIGHAQHGKDTLAEILRKHYGLTFISSSIAALEHAVTPALLAAGLQYDTPEAAFNDRHNHRQLWKDAISAYNTPDKARLCREILERSDLYIGMRCNEEYAATRHLFDLVFWVERPGKQADPTMLITFNPAEMIPIVNAGDISTMEWQVKKELAHRGWINSPEN